MLRHPRKQQQMLTDLQNLTVTDNVHDPRDTLDVDDSILPETTSHTEENVGTDITVDIDDTQDESDQTVAPNAPVYSPLSTLSSSASIGPETGPLRWFSIVATDFQNNQQAAGTYKSIFDPSSRHNSFAQEESSAIGNSTLVIDTPTDGFNFANDPNYRYQPQGFNESQPAWSSDVSLRQNELVILQNFCTKVAEWQDVLDPVRHFTSVLPQLAMRNEGLMKAILALSAKHMSLQADMSSQSQIDSTAALQYYQDTLKYLHTAMKHPDYLKSIEVNATSLILSTYEMLDGMGRGWIRHLKGVFWIQRSQLTNPDSGGLKAAIWWAWLRQDTWAALREKRKVLTIYTPIIPICDLNFWEHANFVSFLFAQCVSYMSDEEARSEAIQLQERIDRAKFLSSALEEWYSYLPINFKAIPLASPAFENDPRSGVEPVWINPPSFGIVLQTYHAAKVILLAHAPAAGGVREFNSRNKQFAEGVDTVCGIAMTIKDGGSSLVSTSCLWACGLCVQDDTQRETISKLIGEHKKITGWPLTDLGDELRREWAKWS